MSNGLASLLRNPRRLQQFAETPGNYPAALSFAGAGQSRVAGRAAPRTSKSEEEAGVLETGEVIDKVKLPDGSYVRPATQSGQIVKVPGRSNLFVDPATGEPFQADPAKPTGLRSAFETARKVARGGKLFAVVPGVGEREIGADPEAEAKAKEQAAKREAENVRLGYAKEKRPYNIDRVTGRPVPLQSDEEWAKAKQEKADKLAEAAAVKKLKAQADKLDIDADRLSLTTPKVSPEEAAAYDAAVSSLEGFAADKDLDTAAEELANAPDVEDEEQNAAKATAQSYLSLRDKVKPAKDAEEKAKELKLRALDLKEQMLDPDAWKAGKAASLAELPDADLAAEANAQADIITEQETEAQGTLELVAKGRADLEQKHAAFLAERQAAEAQGISLEQRQALDAEQAQFEAEMADYDDWNAEAVTSAQGSLKASQDRREVLAAAGAEIDRRNKAAQEQFQVATEKAAVLDKAKPLYDWAKDNFHYTDDYRGMNDYGILDAEAKKAGLDPKQAREALQTFRQLDWSNPRRDAQTGQPIAEESRLLPDGRVTINPGAWGDLATYTKAVEASGASEVAKKQALEQFPQLQEIYAEKAVDILSKSANIPGQDNFMKWRERKIEEDQAQKGALGFTRKSPARQAIEYMDEMKNRSWFRKAGEQIVSGLLVGSADIATQVLGDAAMLTGSETIADLAAANSANSESVVGAQSLEGSDTDYALRVMGMGARMAPGVAAMMAGAGAIGGGVTAASILSGAQTAGGMFADIYRKAKDEGMTHGEAWRKAALPSAFAGAITGLLTRGMGATGLERVFADPVAKEAAKGAFKTYLGQFAKAAAEELPEETADEFFSQIIQGAAESADPAATLKNYVENLPELAGVSALMGGAGGLMQGQGNAQAAGPDGMAPMPAEPQAQAGPAPTPGTVAPAQISQPAQTGDIAGAIKAFTPTGEAMLPQAVADTVKRTNRTTEDVSRAAASGLVKVAQGASLESLDAREREALGFVSKDGKIIPAPKTTPLVETYKGKLVIRNEAAEWLDDEGQPLLARQIRLDEAERKAQIDEAEAKPAAKKKAGQAKPKAAESKPQGSETVITGDSLSSEASSTLAPATNEQDDIRIASETMLEIQARTDPGPEREAALAERRKAAERIVSTLQIGDIITDVDGNEYIVDGKPMNGKVFVKGAGEPVDAVTMLIPGFAKDAQGNRIEEPPATITRKNQPTPTKSISGQPGALTDAVINTRVTKDLEAEIPRLKKIINDAMTGGEPDTELAGMAQNALDSVRAEIARRKAATITTPAPTNEPQPQAAVSLEPSRGQIVPESRELPVVPEQPPAPAQEAAPEPEPAAGGGLTPAQQDQLARAESAHKKRVETITKMEADPEQRAKQLKAEGMKHAAVKRQITGKLTAKEQAAQDKREASNYEGKPVTVEGRPAVVTGNAFGKVKVRFEDGTTKAVPASQVTARQEAPPAPVEEAAAQAATSPASPAPEPSEAPSLPEASQETASPAEAKPPEQMTPEEQIIDAENRINSIKEFLKNDPDKGLIDTAKQQLASEQTQLVLMKRQFKKPLTQKEADDYGAPAGYVREGDLYVYRPAPAGQPVSQAGQAVSEPAPATPLAKAKAYIESQIAQAKARITEIDAALTDWKSRRYKSTQGTEVINDKNPANFFGVKEVNLGSLNEKKRAARIRALEDEKTQLESKLKADTRELQKIEDQIAEQSPQQPTTNETIDQLIQQAKDAGLGEAQTTGGNVRKTQAGVDQTEGETRRSAADTRRDGGKLESQYAPNVPLAKAKAAIADYTAKAEQARKGLKGAAAAPFNRQIIGGYHLAKRLNSLQGAVEYKIETIYDGVPIDGMMVARDGSLVINPTAILELITAKHLDGKAIAKAIDKFLVHEFIHLAALSKISGSRINKLYNSLTPEAKEISSKLYLAEARPRTPPLHIGPKNEEYKERIEREFRAAHEWFAQLVEARMSGEISNQALIEASDDPAFRDKLAALFREFVAALREIAGLVKDPAMAEQIRAEADAVEASVRQMAEKAGLAEAPKAEQAKETPGIPAEGKYSVYQAGGRWLVQQSDKRGFGDHLFDSEEEAVTESLRQQDMARKNAEFSAKQEAAAKAAQEAEEARLKPLNDYLDALGMSAMQRGKLKTALSADTAKQSREKGKIYQGTRFNAAQEMVADGFRATTEQVPAIKEPTGIQWNRMNNQQQAEFERKRKAAGTTTEYRLALPSGSMFVVTKAEHDYAKWLAERPAPAPAQPAEQAAQASQPVEAAAPMGQAAAAATITKEQAEEVLKDSTLKDRPIKTYEMAVAANQIHMGTKISDWSAFPFTGEAQDGKPTQDLTGASEMQKAPTLFPSSNAQEHGNCEWCGKQPVKNFYFIKDDGKKWTLAVGSECITHFADKSGDEMAVEARQSLAIATIQGITEARKTLSKEFSEIQSAGYGRTERVWKNPSARTLNDETPDILGKITIESGAAAHSRWLNTKLEAAREWLARYAELMARPETKKRQIEWRTSRIKELEISLKLKNKPEWELASLEKKLEELRGEKAAMEGTAAAPPPTVPTAADEIAARQRVEAARIKADDATAKREAAEAAQAGPEKAPPASVTPAQAEAVAEEAAMPEPAAEAEKPKAGTEVEYRELGTSNGEANTTVFFKAPGFQGDTNMRTKSRFSKEIMLTRYEYDPKSKYGARKTVNVHGFGPYTSVKDAKAVLEKAWAAGRLKFNELGQLVKMEPGVSDATEINNLPAPAGGWSGRKTGATADFISDGRMLIPRAKVRSLSVVNKPNALTKEGETAGMDERAAKLWQDITSTETKNLRVMQPIGAALTDDGMKRAYFQTIQGNTVTLDAGVLGVFMKALGKIDKWEVTFENNRVGPVIAYRGGEPVGVIMPLSGLQSDGDMARLVEQALARSAPPVTAQPPAVEAAGKPEARPAAKTKSQLAQELAGEEPKDYTLRQQWKKRVSDYMGRSKAELEELLADKAVSDAKYKARAEKIKEWSDYLQSKIDLDDAKWRSTLATFAEQNGVQSWSAMMDNGKGGEIYRLAERLADTNAALPAAKQPSQPEAQPARQAPAAEAGQGQEEAADKPPVGYGDEPAPPAITAPGVRYNDMPLELARQAHSGTSFVPDVRARGEQRQYVAYMNAVWADLEAKAATDEQKATAKAEFAEYRENYVERYKDLLRSRAGLVSAMIAGPSKFPAARMQKRNDAYDKKLNAFNEWDRKAKRRIYGEVAPAESKVISADDANAPEALKAKIEQAKKMQEAMKAANAIVRKKNLTDEQKVKAMVDQLGFRESTAKAALTKDDIGRVGFPDYALTNNLANIKRMEERLKGMEKLRATAAREATFEGGWVEENADLNRVQIFFDAIPSADLRTKLKANGFKWAPSQGAWQRQRTNAAVYAAESMLGVKMASPAKEAQAEPEPADIGPATPTPLPADEGGQPGLANPPGRRGPVRQSDEAQAAELEEAANEAVKEAGEILRELQQQGEQEAREKAKDEAARLALANDPKAVRSIGEGEKIDARNPSLIFKNPAARRFYQAILVARAELGMRTYISDKELQDFARKQFDSDPEGVYEWALDKADEGESLNDEEQAVLFELFDRAQADDSPFINRPGFDQEMVKLGHYIRESRGTTGRMLRYGRDRVETPQQRWKRAFYHIKGPDSKQAAMLRIAPSAREKARRIAELEDQLAKASAARRADVEAALAKAKRQKSRAEVLEEITAENERLMDTIIDKMGGVTRDDIMHSPLERYGAQIAVLDLPAVREALDKFDNGRDIMLLSFRGFSTQHIAGALQIPEGDVADFIKQANAAIVRPAITEQVKAGKTFGDWIKSGLDILARKTGLRQPPSIRPLENWRTLITGKRQTLDEVTAEVNRVMNYVQQSQKARDSKKLMSKVINTPTGQRVRIFVPFDPDDATNYYSFAREYSAAKANVFDKFYEYWINWPLLSGPQTQVVNFTGNAAQVAWHYTGQRLAEATLNALIYHDPNSAQLREFWHIMKGFWKSIGPALDMARQSFLTEGDTVRHKFLNEPLQIDIVDGDIDKVGGIRAAVGGKLGRLNRLPGRVLRWTDSFFKTAVLYAEASAVAYRKAHASAKTQGLKGQARRDFIDTEIDNTLKDPQSPVWADVMDTAEELLFQDDNVATAIVDTMLGGYRGVNAFEKALAEAKASGNSKTVAVLNAMIAGAKAVNRIMRFIFPFQRTPTNIIRAGLRKGGGSAIVGLYHLLHGGWLKYKDKTPMLQSYTKAMQIKDLSETGIAVMGWLMLASMFEGDDDDEKKPFLIVGSRPSSRQGYPEKQAFLNKYGGESSFVWQDSKGNVIASKSFGRYEPIGTLLTTWVDAYRNFQEVRRRQKAGEAASFKTYMLSSFVSGLENKSFLQGLSNIMEWVRDIEERRENPDVDADTKFVLRNIVPNIIKQPLRNLDEVVRETKTAGAGYSALPNPALSPKLPTFAAEPKISTTGQKMRKDLSAPARLLFPANTVVTPQPDALLYRANRLNPTAAKWPSGIQRDEFFYRAPGAKPKTPGYHVPIEDAAGKRRFAEMVGQEYTKEVRNYVASLPPALKARPGPEQIEGLAKAMTEARKKARILYGLQKPKTPAITTSNK